MAIELSEDLGYVALVVVAAFMVNMWMAITVGSARKKYKVFYPTMYASEAENKNAKLFNCVQRSHQNFLEYVPYFFALLFFAGLQHPRVAATVGSLFLVARIVYFVDYSTGDPAKRLRGFVGSMLCLVSLVGCCISFAVHQLYA